MSADHYCLKIGKRRNLRKMIDKKWPKTYKKNQARMMPSRSKNMFGDGRNISNTKY